MKTKTGWVILGEVKSDSNIRLAYRISLTENGQLACGCMGWTRHVPRKDCRHITIFKTGTNAGVTRSMDGDIYLAGRRSAA